MAHPAKLAGQPTGRSTRAQHLAKLRLYLLSQKPNRISNDLVRHAGPMDAEQHGRGTGDLGTAGTLCALAQVYRYAS